MCLCVSYYKFTTKALPNKSGVVCKKAYILFVVKKRCGWAQ